MRWLSRRRRKTVVIGTEMAAAASAENRHQQTSHGPSPIAGLSYELAAGAYDLFRFVELESDDVLDAAVLNIGQLRGEELSGVRAALTQDDLYTLLTFARRTAVRVLRGRTDHLTAGWVGVGLVDLERVDWRDAAIAVGFLAYSADRAEVTLRGPLDSALAVAEPAMGELMRQYANSGMDGLSVGGYREIATPDGPVLVEDYGNSFDPTLDLLAVANSVVSVVENDRYRVTGITTGTDIAPVWLPSEDPHTVEQARQRIRACLSVSAASRTETAETFPAHMFLAYVAECATPDDAALLVKAAKQPTASDIATLAVSHDRLCVEVVARSTVKGVAPVESTASIQRLREPLARVLSNHVDGAR